MTIKITGIPGAENISIEGMAEETTLLRLISLQEKAVKLQQTEYGELQDNVDETTDSFDDLNDSAEAYEESMNRMSKTADQLNAAYVKLQDGIIGIGLATRGFLTSVSTGSESFSAVYNGIGAAVTDLLGAVIEGIGAVTGAIFSLGSAIPFIGGIGTAAASATNALASFAAKIITTMLKLGLEIGLEQLDAAWTMFKAVTNAGGLYGKGLSEMAATMKTLNLNSTEYANLIKNNSEYLARFGGSVAEGSRMLASVTQYQSEYVDGLLEMGITNEEQAERTLEYMDMQQRAGRLRLMTDQEIATGSREYMKSLQVIAALTGKQEDQLKKERNERMLNMAFQAKMRRLTMAGQGKIVDELNLMMQSASAHHQKELMNISLFGNAMDRMGTQVSGMAPLLKEWHDSVESGAKTNEEAFMIFGDQLKVGGDQIIKNSDKFIAAGYSVQLGQGNALAEELAEYFVTNNAYVSKMMETTRAQVKESYDAAIRDKDGEGASGGLATANQELRKMNQSLMVITTEHLADITASMSMINQIALSAIEGLSGNTEKIKEYTGMVLDPEQVIVGMKSTGKAVAIQAGKDISAILFPNIVNGIELGMKAHSKFSAWFDDETPNVLGTTTPTMLANTIVKETAPKYKADEVMRVKQSDEVAKLAKAWSERTIVEQENKENQQEYQARIQTALVRIAEASESQEKTLKTMQRDSQ